MTQVKTQCQYRRTKQGEWVVMGPVSVVKVGETVSVTKKNGETKDETILSVGKPFIVEGVYMVYGHTGHGWQARGPYTPREKEEGKKEEGEREEGREDEQTATAECHLCLSTVPKDSLQATWCDGEAIGCPEHGLGDMCLACVACNGAEG